MARLTIVIDIPADHLDEDPHEVAVDVLDEYNMWAGRNNHRQAEFVHAAWGTPSEIVPPPS